MITARVRHPRCGYPGGKCPAKVVWSVVFAFVCVILIGWGVCRAVVRATQAAEAAERRADRRMYEGWDRTTGNQWGIGFEQFRALLRTGNVPWPPAPLVEDAP